MKSLLCLLIIFLIGFRQIGWSTGIVVVMTKTEIYIGADSRRTFFDKKDVINNFCKIHQVGKFYFAVAGENDGLITELAKNSSKDSKTLAEVGNKYISLIKVYQERIQGLIDKNPNYFEGPLRIGQSMAEVCFFTIENSVPQNFQIKVAIKSISGQKIDFSVESLKNSEVLVLGFVNTLLEKDTNNQYKFKYHGLYRTDPVQYIVKAIKFGADANPKKLNDSINLLRLDKNGPRWLSNPSNCDLTH